jgi:hypothetical protein
MFTPHQRGRMREILSRFSHRRGGQGLPALPRGSANTGENNPNYDFVAPRDKVTVTTPVVRRAHNRLLC